MKTTLHATLYALTILRTLYFGRAGNRARRRKMQNESGTPTPSGRSRVIGCSLRMEPDGKSGFAEQHKYVQAAVHQGDHMAIRIDVCPCKGGPSGANLVFGNIPRIIDRLQRQR